MRWRSTFPNDRNKAAPPKKVHMNQERVHRVERVIRPPPKVYKFEPIEISMGTVLTDEFNKNAPKWRVVERMRARTDKSEYVVWNARTGEWFAMRVERRQNLNVQVYKRVYENHRMEVEDHVIGNLSDCIMLPEYKDSGLSNDYRFVILSLWGPTIEELMVQKGGLHEEDILKLALGSLMSLKELHRAGYAHCDVRPANFAVPFLSGQSPIVMQIDFDFCKCEFSPSDSMLHRASDKETVNARRRETSFVQMPDNLDFSSKRFLKTYQHGRSDDIESWLYMVIGMYVPLPWSGETDEAVLTKKREDLKEFMEKQPRVKFLTPILDLIPSTEEHRDFLPKLVKIGDILLERLKEIKGTVTGKWHFEDECVRNHKMAADEKPEKRSEEETIMFIRYFLSNNHATEVLSSSTNDSLIR